MNVLHVPLSKRKADWGSEGDATLFCKEVRGLSTTLQCCNRHASLFVNRSISLSVLELIGIALFFFLFFFFFRLWFVF